MSRHTRDGRSIYSYSDINHLPFKLSGSGEQIFYCPFCVENGRKTPDTVGRLYYSRKKGYGHCFRCNSLFFRETKFDLKDSASFFTMNVEDLEGPSPEDQWYDISWARNLREERRAVEYLVKQRRLPFELCERHHFRWSPSPEGILMPSDVGWERTHFFQIRLLNPAPGKPKMDSPAASSKPLYGESFFDGHRHLALCEGVISAVSALMISVSDGTTWDVAATYGKGISDYQLKRIAARGFESVTILYDGGEVKAAVQAAKRLSPHVPMVWIGVLPFEKDPNDLLNPSIYERTVLRVPAQALALSVLLEKLPRDQKEWDLNSEAWKIMEENAF